MTERSEPDRVTDEERLARFIVRGRWIRSDQTVRPDAFIPHPHPDLSVTRHKNLSEQELWRVGEGVADAVAKALHGRADVRASAVRRYRLEVEPKPVRDNPNHACIVGWPVEKPAQKIIAQQIVAECKFVRGSVPAA